MKKAALIILVLVFLSGQKIHSEDIKYTAKQGETLIIDTEEIAKQLSSEIKDLKFYIFNREYQLIEYKGKNYLIVGIHFEQKPGIYKIKITIRQKGGNLIIKEIPLRIEETKYPEIEMKSAKTILSKKLSERRQKENENLMKVLCFNQPSPSNSYQLKMLIPPVENPEETSIRGTFGIIRKWKNKITTRHRGVDLKAPFVPVYSINDGKVVMAQNYLLEGNFIIVDHGSAIFSLYIHLSKINVKEGQYIKRGEKIGISGNTGNAKSDGPHLHFAIKINCATVDPLYFLKRINSEVKNEKN